MIKVEGGQGVSPTEEIVVTRSDGGRSISYSWHDVEGIW